MTDLKARPKALTVNVFQRGQDFLSPLNLHYAAVAILGALIFYLAIAVGVAWHAASADDADALAQQRVALKAAQIAARPLEGLDVKLRTASEEADRFSYERLPVSYSEVATELGVLARRDSVRLTRVQYAQSPVEGDAAGQLTQVAMDASLSGDYRGLVQFINGLERDHVFFLISGVTLTGAQNGQVNLRAHLTTYIRGLGSEEEMRKVQIVPVIDIKPDVKPDATAPAATSTGGTP